MNFRGATGTLGLLLAGAVALASPQREPLDIAGFRTKIQQILADGMAPSLAVAVARDGQMLWSEGFGFADREARIPATADTPYSVASVTKPFTATAVMILAERHRLALDTPIGRYVEPLVRPGVAAPDEVTLLRILGHVAGFPAHYQYFFDDQHDRPLSFSDTMRCYGAEIQKPGTRYTYSNLGFEALGETVSRVSGQPYRDFLAREIFAPLGLTRTSVPGQADDAAGAARRYGRDGSLLPFFVTDFPAASALYASAEDLVRFGSFHAGALMAGQRAVLTPASISAMQQAGPGDYGLGWSVNRTWNRHPVVWHSGAMPGAAATLWLVPAERIAIAVVANQIGAPVNQLAGEILAALLPAGPTATTVAPSGTPRPIPTAASAANPFGRYRGTVGTCPTPQPLAVNVRGPGDVTVTFGPAGEGLLEDATLEEGRVLGSFNSTSGARASNYRLDLRRIGDRLEGVVTRRTGLGPRANVAVTLWAELARER